jgi:predicted acyl esterase
MTSTDPLTPESIPLLPAGDPASGGWPGLHPSTEVLAAGTSINGGRALTCDIVVERDVAVPMRDGITIYTDVLRPVGDEAVPALVAWSPYGKQDPGWLLTQIPGRAGIPVEAVSGLQKWEGPDPAYWCAHGYAVVNPDARGVNASGGDVLFWGDREARDVEDLLAWIGGQSWSSGDVGMSGNSWLAVSQWYAAARRPAQLKAIAPWEGEVDFYRDFGTRGGIPSGDRFVEFTIKGGMRGPGGVEDVPRMIRERLLWDDYWEDKRAAVEAIDVPAYVVACWTQFHSHGTLDGFRRLAGEKWLRVHNTHEWPDYYDPERVDDLRRFFDHHLKGVDNGWQDTAPVRISVLDPGGQDTVDRAEDAWPLERAAHTPLYLDGETMTLVDTPVTTPSELAYPAIDGQARFTYRFAQDTELIGHSCLNLRVQAEGSSDMDLFVTLEKLDEAGEPLAHLVLGMPAPLTTGQLRVSHRETDPGRTTAAEPFHPHRHERLLTEGEIVSVPLGLWATSVRFHAGQQLALTIAGHRIAPSELNLPSEVSLRNRGRHVLHLGGPECPHLLVPLLAPAEDRH